MKSPITVAVTGGAGQVASGIAATGNQATQQRLGRALDTRPTIAVDAGQLCNVLLIKPLHLPALWQYGGRARATRAWVPAPACRGPAGATPTARAVKINASAPK